MINIYVYYLYTSLSISLYISTYVCLYLSFCFSVPFIFYLSVLSIFYLSIYLSICRYVKLVSLFTNCACLFFAAMFILAPD